MVDRPAAENYSPFWSKEIQGLKTPVLVLLCSEKKKRKKCLTQCAKGFINLFYLRGKCAQSVGEMPKRCFTKGGVNMTNIFKRRVKLCDTCL